MAANTSVKRDTLALALTTVVVGLIGKDTDPKKLAVKRANLRAMVAGINRAMFTLEQCNEQDADTFIAECLKGSGKGKRFKGAANHSYEAQAEALLSQWANAGRMEIE
jgi:hypothetical protein